MNRQWRAKENPNHLEREEKLQELRRQRLEHQFQDVLKGNLTAQINWLLVELSGPAMASYYLTGNGSLRDSDLNVKFDPDTLRNLWLGNGRSQSSGLVFAATDPKVLEAPWPLALRSPQFADLRSRFEASREAVLTELRSNRTAELPCGESLLKCVDDLIAALENEYPSERRKEVSEFLTYNSAKRFLRSLIGQVHRVLQAPAIRRYSTGPCVSKVTASWT